MTMETLEYRLQRTRKRITDLEVEKTKRVLEIKVIDEELTESKNLLKQYEAIEHRRKESANVAPLEKLEEINTEVPFAIPDGSIIEIRVKK